jgi:phage gp45-like
MTPSDFAKFTAETKTRVKGMIRRLVRKDIYPDLPGQEHLVEVLEDELHDNVETAESYGHTAVPPDDIVEGIAAFLGGNSDHGMILAWLDKTYRPTDLGPGELCTYTIWQHELRFIEGYLYLRHPDGHEIEMNADEVIVKHNSGHLITMKPGIVEVKHSELHKFILEPDRIARVEADEFIVDAKFTVNGNADFTGATVRHGTKNIGKTHTHGGVSVGTADSDVPNP